LSDGTAVWLNAASKLTFPVTFKGKERRVKLSGEAYFEVAHNKNSPFLVETNNQTVKVLGTHFNINAYNDENYTKTTLIEGSVKVQSATNLKPATLLPGEQATLGNNTLVKNTVDTKEVLAWKNKMFRIYDQDLYSIMKQIGRWYNVDVEYRGNLSDLRFGLYISKKRNIEQVLELMEVTKTVKFKIEGRKVIVIK
jgi:ferric-dicitrate binding protein FerR (iron transport regulator)